MEFAPSTSIYSACFSRYESKSIKQYLLYCSRRAGGSRKRRGPFFTSSRFIQFRQKSASSINIPSPGGATIPIPPEAIPSKLHTPLYHRSTMSLAPVSPVISLPLDEFKIHSDSSLQTGFSSLISRRSESRTSMEFKSFQLLNTTIVHLSNQAKDSKAVS